MWQLEKCVLTGEGRKFTSKSQNKFALHRHRGKKGELILIQTYLVPNTVRRCYICCFFFFPLKAPLSHGWHRSYLTHEDLWFRRLQVLFLTVIQLVSGRWDPNSKSDRFGFKVQVLTFYVCIFNTNKIKWGVQYVVCWADESSLNGE